MLNFRIAFLKAAGFVLCISAILFACSKGGGGSVTPPNPCAGVTIAAAGLATDADAGSSNGSIAASASGGTGPYTFSINGGTFQGSANFASLAKGNYTITAKDSKGCTGSTSVAVNEKNTCAGVTITLTDNSTASDPCGPNGTITLTAGGSTGFTYSINTGAYQASNIFNNVAPGVHTLNAKDVNGCTKSISVTVATATAGTTFSAAKAVIQTNCAISGCHTGGSPTGGINFSVDCNIVINKDRIKARAIDANPSIMPPTGALPQADRDKITAWITAGGKYTD